MEIDFTIRNATTDDIRRLFSKLLINASEFPGLKPSKTEVKKNPAKPAKKTPAPVKTMDYHIPFSTVTQPKEYKAAWYLCKKTGKPYPEAIKDLQQDPPGPAAGKVPEAPAKIAGSEALAAALPADRPPTGGEKKKAAAAGPPGPYAIGSEVREIGDKKTHNGIGKIKRAPQMSTQVMVEFEHGTAWISKDNLEPVQQQGPAAAGR